MTLNSKVTGGGFCGVGPEPDPLPIVLITDSLLFTFTLLRDPGNAACLKSVLIRANLFNPGLNRLKCVVASHA